MVMKCCVPFFLYHQRMPKSSMMTHRSILEVRTYHLCQIHELFKLKKGNKVKIFWICNLHIIAAGLQKYINVWFLCRQTVFCQSQPAYLPYCQTNLHQLTTESKKRINFRPKQTQKTMHKLRVYWKVINQDISIPPQSWCNL